MLVEIPIFSRRVAIGVSAALLVGLAANESTSKEGLENELGIKILTVREPYAAKGLPYPANERHHFTGLYKRDVPLNWSLEKLHSLRAFFSALPEHYRASSGGGEKLGVVLSNGDCQCEAAYKESKPHRVEMTYTRFQRPTRKGDFVVFAHELTHVYTPFSDSTLEYSEEAGKLVEVSQSPWFGTINQLLNTTSHAQTSRLLGQRFRDATEDLYDKLPEKRPETKEEWGEMLRETYTSEEREKYDFYDHLGDMLMSSHQFMREFVAFLAENYVQGEPYFQRRMSELLPGEYQAIYNFTKDEIFRGKKYSKHPFA